jgi:hypothetical protein
MFREPHRTSGLQNLLMEADELERCRHVGGGDKRFVAVPWAQCIIESGPALGLILMNQEKFDEQKKPNSLCSALRADDRRGDGG